MIPELVAFAVVFLIGCFLMLELAEPASLEELDMEEEEQTPQEFATRNNKTDRRGGSLPPR